jgi:hypothetical protein
LSKVSKTLTQTSDAAGYSNAMSQENVEIVRAMYEVANAGDKLEANLESWCLLSFAHEDETGWRRGVISPIFGRCGVGRS